MNYICNFEFYKPWYIFWESNCKQTEKCIGSLNPEAFRFPTYQCKTSVDKGASAQCFNFQLTHLALIPF
jgi:hypothetical protein